MKYIIKGGRRMSSVTGRVNNIEQPYGGYLPIKDFLIIDVPSDDVVKDKENIHPSLVGLAVDYLTRFMMGTSKKDVFRVSLLGAEKYDFYNDKLGTNPEFGRACELLKAIVGLDDVSIKNTCKIVGYDVCFRASIAGYKDIDEINPNKYTINNIKIMVKRCIRFWELYGPIVEDGFTFGNAYTETIDSGDGDYLTKDTLWDLKVLKGEPNRKHTLQILVYYIMGKKSSKPEFESINKLGIFNPRKNKIYTINVENIPQFVFDEVSYNVIGYKEIKTIKEKKKRDEVYEIGDKVKHSVYGIGRVLEVKKVPSNYILKIRFMKTTMNITDEYIQLVDEVEKY